VRIVAGDGDAGGEAVSVRGVSVLRGVGGGGLRTRLILPDGSARALNWTNRHPNQASRAGLVLFRHSGEVVDGAMARRLIAQGARIETTHPERIRRALGFGEDEPGVVGIEEAA
jgi:hypothetical protein